jgi:hypothetical protein
MLQWSTNHTMIPFKTSHPSATHNSESRNRWKDGRLKLVRPPPGALDLGENMIPDPRAVIVTELGAKPFFILLLVSIRTTGTRNKYFHSVKLVRKRFTCTIEYSSCHRIRVGTVAGLAGSACCFLGPPSLAARELPRFLPFGIMRVRGF